MKNVSFFDRRIVFHHSVADPDDAMRVPGDILFMCYQDDRIPLLVKLVEQAHYLNTRF